MIEIGPNILTAWNNACILIFTLGGAWIGAWALVSIARAAKGE